ncbi:MAG: hypothetical protein HDT39_13315 [Lachnospiraceae bacterium]|nr:hypothetical protein [Lachnospiraceae bacterium]
MWIDINDIKRWKPVVEKVVGGLEWIGFSKFKTEKLLCISSQKITIIDCDNGNIIETDADYDEENYIAFCDALPDEEICISGQYGGKMEYSTSYGDKVIIETSPEYISTVIFMSESEKEHVIFNDYGFYTCGFSYDGKYFVFSQDAGITILKRGYTL